MVEKSIQSSAMLTDKTDGSGIMTFSIFFDHKPRLPLLERLKQLREDGKFCDMILEVNGVHFKAHKNVLAAWSPYLFSLFDVKKVSSENFSISCNDVDAFSSFIDFLYSGIITIKDSNVIAFLHLAESLCVTLLKEFCEEYLKKNLQLSNYMKIYALSNEYKLSSLEEQTVGFLQMKLSEAVKEEDFLTLSSAKINQFLSGKWTKTLKAEVKLFLIVSWVGHNVREREQYLVILLRHIEWEDVAGDFLLEINNTENFFTLNESSLFILLHTLYAMGISLGPYVDSFPLLRQRYSHLIERIADLPAALTSGMTTKNDLATFMVVSNQEKEATDSLHKLLHDKPKEANDTPSKTTEQHAELASGASCDEENSSKLAETFRPTKQRIKRKWIQRGMEVQTRSSIKRIAKLTNASLKKTKRRLKSSVGGDTKVKSKTMAETVKRRKRRRQINRSRLLDEHLDDDDYLEPCYKASSEESERDSGKETSNKAKHKKRGRPRKGKEKRQKCPECSYVAPCPNRLESHIDKSHRDGTTYNCSICPFQCNWNRNYYAHMKEHFEGPSFKCDFPDCKYTAERIQALLVHRMSHTDERPFQCTDCPMKFRTKNNLIAHLKSHSGERPFECPVCKRCFATKNTMQQHLVIHSDHRPYLCDICGFATKYQSHLISHKRIHTGEVFQCQVPNCSYATPKRSQLKAHVRSHLGIRNHTCDTCGKSFVEKSHLVRHARIHLDDKPFKCSECEYATTRLDKMKEHVCKHHGLNPSAKVRYKPRKPRASQEICNTMSVPTSTYPKSSDNTLSIVQVPPPPLVYPSVDQSAYSVPQSQELNMLPGEQFPCMRSMNNTPAPLTQTPITPLEQQVELKVRDMDHRPQDITMCRPLAPIEQRVVDDHRHQDISICRLTPVEQNGDLKVADDHRQQDLSMCRPDIMTLGGRHEARVYPQNAPTTCSNVPGQHAEYGGLNAFMALF